MPDPYDKLEPGLRAQIELDALPKDETNPLADVPPGPMPRGDGATGRTGTPRLIRHQKLERARAKKPTWVKPFDEPEVFYPHQQCLAEAYRNKVAGDAFAARGDQRQADEFYAQEKQHLTKAESFD